jgi:RHS repeat-associated protein
MALLWLDSQTGLLYDTFRYYDPLSGQYVRSDNVQDNASGMNPYAYVGDNPETRNDPSGHCWPLCAITAVVGAAVGFTVGVVHQAQTGDWSAKAWSHTAADTGMGAVDGFLIGTGVGTAAVVGTLIGGATGVIAHNIDPKHNDGIQGVFESAAMGGITNALASGLAGGSMTLLGKAATGVGNFINLEQSLNCVSEYNSEIA